jgi:CHAD domain-containing protein
VPKGPVRLAIDLATGGGGDRSVLMAGDDNGIVAIQHSNTWSFETTATNASLLRQRWGIEPHHVSYDVEGVGADFANRLKAVGIIGAKPYRGADPAPGRADRKFGNKRSYGAWRARQRLDPERRVITSAGVSLPQNPYAIKKEHVHLMREELQGLRYLQDEHGRICLEVKEEFVKRLKHSPDFADAFGQLHWLMAQTEGDE